LAPEGSQPGPDGHQAAGAGHEESAYVRGRTGTGGQAQGRAGLDGGQDLEAEGEEGRYREAGVAPKPRLGKVGGISNLIQPPLFPELELLLAVHPVAAVTIGLVL
jgi:hypothetical protein